MTRGIGEVGREGISLHNTLESGRRDAGMESGLTSEATRRNTDVPEASWGWGWGGRGEGG